MEFLATAIDFLFDSSSEEEDKAIIRFVQQYAERKDRKRGKTSRKRVRGTRTARQRTNTVTSPSQIPVKIPYSNVDSTLRSLAGQAEGFGRFAIGGLHGEIYNVTTLSDDGPGSLRAACRMKEPIWIVFDVSGTIKLSSCLNVSSYKTIDGRGQRIKLTGKGLKLKECEHVIICNLELEGGRGPDVDGIQIKPNSKYIWIDRCSLKDFDDGLINISCQSTNITISRCHFSNHDKTMLIGADASHHGDRCMYVTIHHCFFDGTRQRHPHVRFAKVHLYNNYTRDWGIYAVRASVESQIFSQFNIYEAGPEKVAFKYLKEKADDKEEESTGCIISEGDLFMTGTKPGLLEQTTSSDSFHPSQHYQTWTVEPATNELKQILQHSTGWKTIPRPPELLGSDSIERQPGRDKLKKAARTSQSSDDGNLSRAIGSSKEDEVKEYMTKSKVEMTQNRQSTLEFFIEQQNLRAAFTGASILAVNTKDITDKNEVKRIEKQQKEFCEKYKKYIEVSK